MKMRAAITSKAILSSLIGFFVCLALLVTFHPPSFAQTSETTENTENPDNSDAELEAKKKKIEEIQAKLKEIEGQKISLSTTLQYINTKISLSQAEIDKTRAELNTLERQLTELDTRINGLEQSLDVLSKLLIDRIAQQYKRQQTPPVQLLIDRDLPSMFEEVKYLEVVQDQMKKVIVQAEQQKETFDEQKRIKESKQEEVERKRQTLAVQQQELTSQRESQKVLLQQTQNDETKYQAELQKTLAEIQAIQGIIAGQGNETKVRDVSKGDNIASIISGASPCSTGTHLHFEVVKNGVHQNPGNYLSGISAEWNNSPDGSFGFGGGWDWPLNNPAKINQGYGMTYYARVRRAYGGAPHTGIDMASKSSGDNTVKAVQDGVLFRGGIACGGRTLQYVRVIHKEDANLSTYYLHVNY